MIVPMEKVTLIAAAGDRLKTVRHLCDLGVMHIESVSLDENPGRIDLASLLNEIRQVLARLEMVKAGRCAPAGDETGEAIFRAARQAFAELDELTEAENGCRRQLALLEPWGDFDAALPEELKARGVYVYLCKGTKKEVAALRARGLLCREISGGKAVYFAVVSDVEIPGEELPLERVPRDVSLGEERKKLERLKLERERCFRELGSLRCHQALLSSYGESIEAALEFVTVKDTFDAHGAVVTVGGYVPQPELEAVRAAARENGWGLLHRPVDPKEDAAPTLLKRNKLAELISPLFTFLDIEPGYTERDMSLPVLFFFTIFFGMLIGDAAYGLIFLAASVAGLIVKKGKARQLFALLTILSTSAVIWGTLTNNFFGMSIPGVGLDYLASDPNKDQHVQLVCFVLGLIQMSLGHLMQMSNFSLRNILNQLGWITLLAANLVLVYLLLLFPGPIPHWLLWVYGVGVFLTAVFGINWKDVSSIFGYFSSAMGSFIDLLSYIRLFAVGLSGYYLAVSFNGMAQGFLGDWRTVPVAVFILLVGHCLTVALAVLGVLVHGIRLNLLEFSSHSEITWSGYRFRPFRKHDIDDDTINPTIMVKE